MDGLTVPRFVRRELRVEAHLYDGSPASARAIASAFPHRVARPVDRDDGLLVLCGSRLVRVLEDSYVAEDEVTRQLQIVPADQFELGHAPVTGA